MKRRLERSAPALAGTLVLLAALLGCGGGDDGEEGRGGRPEGRAASGARPGGGGAPGRGGFGGPPGAGGETAAVPVEVEPVVRRGIASYIETNGTLEAENEVDLVARISGPITELRVEEGQRVAKGELMARIDDREVRAQLGVAAVNLEEANQAHERAEALYRDQLISQETYDQAASRREAALAEHEARRIQLGYTEIRAPFTGLLVRRYVRFAEYVNNGAPLFRLSDFDPLLCPIQVPERELSRLATGQSAYLEVESWPGERFAADVLRIRPVVDSATGTIEVTLRVAGRGKLQPGMFASVFLETERRENALVIPKNALSLDTLGDTVFIVDNGVAARREVELGFQEGDSVEVVDGLAEGDRVVVLGQAGLAQGTPVRIADDGEEASGATAPGVRPAVAGPPGAAPASGAAAGFGNLDPSQLTPERLEMLKQRMRERGLTDEQIEERLERMRNRAGAGAEGGSGGGADDGSGDDG